MSLPPPEKLLWMYETMLLIRRYEESLAARRGDAPGVGRPALGQEPVAVGVCAHLRDTDTVVGTHRPHHFAIAKGVPLDRMAAGAFDVASAAGPGPGALIDLVDAGHRFSASAAAGAGMPPACGAALAAKMLHTRAVTVAFFGEQAAHRAVFHESLSLAARWRLPLIFVCEDGGPAEPAQPTEVTIDTPNTRRAAAYGIEGIRVASNEALAVYEAAGQAIERARGGQGPTLVDVKSAALATAGGEPTQAPADPIEALARQMRSWGLLDDGRDRTIRSRVDERVQAAIGFARRVRSPSSPVPVEHEPG